MSRYYVYGIPGTAGCLVTEKPADAWMLEDDEEGPMEWLYSLLGTWTEAMTYYHQLQGWEPYRETP